MAPSSRHEICVPPVWGERVPGSPLLDQCIMCQESLRHLAIRCVQCHQTSACCSCLWTYMRARYNRGCPLCRFGDPGENQNPLGELSSASARIARSGTGRGAVPGLDRRGGPAIVMVRVRSRGIVMIGGGIAVGRGSRGDPLEV